MTSESSNHTTSKANTNGVLPITAAQTAGKTVVKVSNPKLKVVIRRLPPGLTEAEFTQIIGEEWAVGHGKVDWFSYKAGKESKDPSKPSYPSRAYLHLLHNDHLMTLSEAVRNSLFEDARNTWNNSCLIGPPSVEFAPYGRVPSGKRRNDARQGTIDQDPDFMDFLESLANPAPNKELTTENSTEEERAKNEAVTTTPLVQFLKDKKANKGKEVAAVTKPGKTVTVKAISKPSKEPSPPPEDVKKKGKDAKIERLVGKAAKEAVKVLNRETASKSTTSSIATTSSTAPTTTPESPVKTPRAAARERGSIAAAARLIQRDLGLSPSNAHRKAKADIAAADAKAASASSAGDASSPTAANPAPPTGPRGSATEPRSRGRGNRGESGKMGSPSKDRGKNNTPVTTPTAPVPTITLLKKPAIEPPIQPAAMSSPARTPTPAQNKTPTVAQNKAQPTPTGTTSATTTPSSSRQRNTPAQPTPSAGATRAFVKHANPSQGITEVLLKEALETYGATSSVEIDKRKGFAYVDFVNAEGLAKAMKANPIKIANGTVQVLERKDRESQSGGGSSNKSGASNVENASTNAGGGGGGGSSGRNGGRGGRGGRGSAAATPTPTASGGTVGRNRGRNGRGGGGAASTTASQASSSSTPTASTPSTSKEVPTSK